MWRIRNAEWTSWLRMRRRESASFALSSQSADERKVWMNRGAVSNWGKFRNSNSNSSSNNNKCNSEYITGPLQEQTGLAHPGSRVSAPELEFQETLIAERESEIREIESGIHELNDIFRDLGTIVEQQGGLIGVSSPAFLVWSSSRATLADNIESNITSVAQNTSSAADELTTAHEYQRKSGRRMACLLIILVVVVLFILLAVSMISIVDF